MCSLTGSPSSDIWRTNPSYCPNSISLRDTHCCSVTKSYRTLKPCGLQHARHPCPSLSPAVCSGSCLLSRQCHLNHLILCRPLLLLPSIFPNIRVFSNESALCIRWSKNWSFSISPSTLITIKVRGPVYLTNLG